MLTSSSAVDESDICEPLQSAVVCRSLDASDVVCRPTGWAGHVIRAVVNTTVTTLAQLERHLRTDVRYDDPAPSVSVTGSGDDVNNESRDGGGAAAAAAEDILNGSDAAVEIAELVLLTTARVTPLITCFLLCWASATYLAVYLYVDPVYLSTTEAEEVRLRRVELIPLQLGRLTGDQYSGADGLFGAVLQVVFSALCAFLDFSLAWSLDVVRRHSTSPYDVTGARSIRSVVRGNGTLAGILRELLVGFHPAHWFGFVEDSVACLPHPRPPDTVTVVVVGSLSGAFLLGIALRRSLVRLKSRICAGFYPHREVRRNERLGRIVRTTARTTESHPAAATSTGTDPRTSSTCECHLLSHVIGGLRHGAVTYHLQSSMCVVCGSRIVARTRRCVTCRQLDATGRQRRCHRCVKAIENNADGVATQFDRNASRGYVDLL